MKYKINENGVDREMTKDEQDQYIAWETEQIANAEAKKAELLAKQVAKTALLERLGITADEAALLLS